MEPFTVSIARGAAWVGGAVIGTFFLKLMKSGMDNVRSQKEDPHAPGRHHIVKIMATTTMARFDSAATLYEDELKENQAMRENFELLRLKAKEVLDKVNEYVAFSQETADKLRARLHLIRESLSQVEEVLKTSMQAKARARHEAEKQKKKAK